MSIFSRHFTIEKKNFLHFSHYQSLFRNRAHMCNIYPKFWYFRNEDTHEDPDLSRNVWKYITSWVIISIKYISFDLRIFFFSVSHKLLDTSTNNYSIYLCLKVTEDIDASTYVYSIKLQRIIYENYLRIANMNFTLLEISTAISHNMWLMFYSAIASQN